MGPADLNRFPCWGSDVLQHLADADAVKQLLPHQWTGLSPDLLSLFRGSQLQGLGVILYLSKELTRSRHYWFVYISVNPQGSFLPLVRPSPGQPGSPAAILEQGRERESAQERERLKRLRYPHGPKHLGFSGSQQAIVYIREKLLQCHTLFILVNATSYNISN